MSNANRPASQNGDILLNQSYSTIQTTTSSIYTTVNPISYNLTIKTMPKWLNATNCGNINTYYINGPNDYLGFENLPAGTNLNVSIENGENSYEGNDGNWIVGCTVNSTTYYFSNWTGYGTGSVTSKNSTITLKMIDNITEIAYFTAAPIAQCSTITNMYCYNDTFFSSCPANCQNIGFVDNGNICSYGTHACLTSPVNVTISAVNVVFHNMINNSNQTFSTGFSLGSIPIEAGSQGCFTATNPPTSMTIYGTKYLNQGFIGINETKSSTETPEYLYGGAGFYISNNSQRSINFCFQAPPFSYNGPLIIAVNYTSN